MSSRRSRNAPVDWSVHITVGSSLSGSKKTYFSANVRPYAVHAWGIAQGEMRIVWGVLCVLRASPTPFEARAARHSQAYLFYLCILVCKP